MAQARGYTLVETVVVICIISILLALGTLRFNEYLRRYRMEAQTRMIHAELQKARTNALYERRATRVKLYADRFEVYSTLSDIGVAPMVSRPLSYAIVFNCGSHLDFDDRGIAMNLGSLCLNEGDGAAGVDSVVIAKTRVSLGKKDRGEACASASITKR